MKITFFKTSLCVLLLSCATLPAQNEFIKYSKTEKITTETVPKLVEYHSQNDSIPNEVQLLTSDSLVLDFLTALSKTSILTAATKSDIKTYIEHLDDHAIIFIHRPMTLYDIPRYDTLHRTAQHDISLMPDDLQRHQDFVLHEEHGVASDYLWGTQNIMIITLGPSDRYFAPDKKEAILRNMKVKIEYEPSFFARSVKDLTSLAKSTLVMSTSEVITDLAITITVLEPSHVKAPCTIVISHKTFEEDLKFKVHERNVASLQVGVTRYQLDKKQFQITNQQLVITLDTTQQKEWKSNLIVMFDLHLPRDVDRFEPLWKKPSLKGQGRRKVGYGFYYYTFYRTGIFGGLSFSKDPLQSVYGGFNYAVSNDFCFNFGWSWHNEYKPSVTSIGDIQSVKDAKEYADRDYGKPAFFWGIAMSPSAMIETLGLKKE